MEWLQSIVGARVAGAIELSSDLDQLRDSLPRVNRLMEKAEWWRFKDKYIEQLLKELRDAKYDAEDVIAEFDYYQLKQQIEGKTTNQLVTSLISFIKNLVSNSSLKVKDLQNKLHSICGKLEIEFGSLGLHDGSNPYGKALQPETTSFLSREVFGRGELVEKVLKLMMPCGDDAGSSNEASSSLTKRAKRRKIENFSVLPIVGMGGMGKTTLAQQIYNDERVENCFDLRIWVCVSDYFDLKKITKEMIESINRESAAKKGLRNYENQIGFRGDLPNLDSLQHILKGKIASRRYFLVLDDVWHHNIGDWESLCNPLRFGAQESMILITTREATVAEVVGTLDSIELKGLPNDMFWELFKKCAFGSDDTSAYPELEIIGKKIASKLEGNPLAAKTLGGILCVNMTIMHWRNILGSELWQLEHNDNNYLAALKVSYQYLPIHLKRCFAICSLFPKYFPLKECDLGPIWMADGIIAREKKIFYVEQGEQYFDDLKRRSFIMCPNSRYLLHDHMYDLAKYLSQDMCYCQEEKDWSLKSYNSARHLSVYREQIELIDREIGMCKKLRSLVFLHSFHYQINKVKLGVTILASLFKKLSYLRLLDLRNCKIEELPEDIGSLKLLIHLNLEETGIRRLPDSLCQLYNLEFINLEMCSVESLPDKFNNLINLRQIKLKMLVINPVNLSLKLYWMNLSSKVPQIGRLTCLENLEKFIVLKAEGHKIEELKNMTRLRGYLRITNLENVEGRDDAAQARLDNKEHLTGLFLIWSRSRDTSPENGDTATDEDTIEGLQPHSNLKFLNIQYYGGRTLPSWLQTDKFSHLCSLDIIGCSNLISLEYCFIPYMLSSLEKLSIINCVNLLSVPFEWIRSSALTSLEIQKCPLLSCPTNIILPSSLTSLGLGSCGEFEKSLPSCLQNLHSLKNLRLINCQHITSLSSQVTNHLNDLMLKNCVELQCLKVSNSSALKNLIIEKCPKLIQLDPSEAGNEASHQLSLLHDLCIIDCVNLCSLQLKWSSSSSLYSLEIKNCPQLSCPTNLILPSSLERLSLDSASGEFSKSLSTCLQNLHTLHYLDLINHQHITSLPSQLTNRLYELHLSNCPELQCIEVSNSSTLRMLVIEKCPKLIQLDPSEANNEAPRESNKQLRYLSIDNTSLLKLPFLRIPPCLLNYFGIRNSPEGRMFIGETNGWLNELENLWRLEYLNCSNLECLPGELHTLVNLEFLTIKNCPKIQSLPKNGLPPSLLQLYFGGCHPTFTAQLKQHDKAEELTSSTEYI